MPDLEWLGGRYSVSREPASDVVLWLELPRDVLLVTKVVEPHDRTTLARSLEDAMRSPCEGPPRRPARIRVADERIARELRAAAGGIPIVVAPVPELDAVFAQMIEAVSGASADATYLDGGKTSPGAVATLFATADVLFRAAPWEHVAAHQVVRIDVPRYGVDGGCLSVIGASGDVCGLTLFPSLEAYAAFMREADDAEAGGGVLLRSISFSAEKDVPPALLREIEQHGWRVGHREAYPVLMSLGPAWRQVPVTETDVRVLSAATHAFLMLFARRGDIFDGDAAQAVQLAGELDDGTRVTVTAPWVDDEALADAVDALATAPSLPEVGRNDPCPCGSGKKYKKCHLDENQTARRATVAPESVHQMDHRLVNAIDRFGSNRFGLNWLPVELDDLDDDAFELVFPWQIWTAEREGQRVADLYFEQLGTRLPAEEREWSEAQRAGWMSIWEVTAVVWGRLEVRDLLTGETRSVREVLASERVVVRDALLARVLDHRGRSYFVGMHARPLPPSSAAIVVDAVREELAIPDGRVPVERLRDPRIGWSLIDEWTVVVDELEERMSALPELYDRDGERIEFVTDTFAFDPPLRVEIEQRIESMEDFAHAEARNGEREHVFVRASDDRMLGRVVTGAGTLRVETESEARADLLRGRVLDACGDAVSHDGRTFADLPSVPDDPPPVEPRSPEEQAMLRRIKEEHYRKWLDMPLPLLGGRTPREASRTAKSRRQLDLLLRDLENLEGRLPEAERFDVSRIRGELDLEP